MIGLLFSAVSGGYSLYNLRQQEANVDKKEGEGAIATKRIEKYVCNVRGARDLRLTIALRERAAISLQFTSDLCDLIIPTTALGFTSFDDGLVGLAGTTSSLIGVYSQWKKTA